MLRITYIDPTTIGPATIGKNSIIDTINNSKVDEAKFDAITAKSKS